MRRPFVTMRTVPKSNGVVRVFVEECSKILRNCNEMQLEWMERQIKNMSCSWNGICNNNNIFSIRNLNSLVNSISIEKNSVSEVVMFIINCFGKNVSTIAYM